MNPCRPAACLPRHFGQWWDVIIVANLGSSPSPLSSKYIPSLFSQTHILLPLSILDRDRIQVPNRAVSLVSQPTHM